MLEIKNKNYQKAEEYLTNSLKANPQNAETFNNLGFLYTIIMDESETDSKRKDELLEKALYNFNKALSIYNNFIQAKYNLGLCYMRKGNFENAKRYFTDVIKSDPQGNYAEKASTFLLVIELTEATKKLHRQKQINSNFKGAEVQKWN